MYWFIATLWAIGGTVILWVVLSHKWNRIDPLFRRALQLSRTFHPIPGDLSYLDLKFSMLRHAVFFLISAIILYFSNSSLVSNIILFLNGLYAILSIFRYRGRKQKLAELAADPEEQNAAIIIATPIKDSFCCVVHAVLCDIFIAILLLLKP